MGTLPSGLPEEVGDEEDLARFLTSSSQFNALMAKPSAFLPGPKDDATSVFRHGSEPREALWQIGTSHVVHRTLHGAAIVKTRHVRAALLEIVAQEPPSRHANIIGWPSLTPDPELGKAKRKEQAALIAQHAEVVRR
jgi:hypothetical protein